MKKPASRLAALIAIAMTVVAADLHSPPAAAFSIELKRAAPQRIERQRAYTLRTPERSNIEPDTDLISQRLAALGIDKGSPVFLRIFKAESRLELWIRKHQQFVLYRSYPICFWSGTLGPKQHEGDGQTPEGFYTITRRGLHWSARWARSFNLGFPNRLDKRNGRSGSYILIHGGCSSTGCFSMTNHVMSEIHALVRAAMKSGQRHVHTHVFPFRMTQANLRAHAQSAAIDFWLNLKPAFDAFEKNRQPPAIAICGKRYVVGHATSRHAGTGPIRAIDNRRRARARADAPTCPSTTTATDDHDRTLKAPL